MYLKRFFDCLFFRKSLNLSSKIFGKEKIRKQVKMKMVDGGGNGGIGCGNDKY